MPNGQRLSGSVEKVTPKLQNLLNEYKPKETVVALGANEISGPSRDQITSLLNQIKQSQSSMKSMYTYKCRLRMGYAPTNPL